MRARTAILRLAPVLGIALGASAALAQHRAFRAPPRSLFHRGDAPVTLGPTPTGVSSVDAEACGACHAEIAREWRASSHSRAWTDDVFQAAYAIEPMAFCRNCHAPLTSARAAHPSALAVREGVSCAVCHVRAGAVLTASSASAAAPTSSAPGSGTAAPSRRAPHPVMTLRSMSESSYCAGCHQFNFPADPGPGHALYASDEPMQDTHSEWAMSTAAQVGTQCQGCHMPLVASADGGTHHSHRFPGGDDRALLARAVRIEARATREGGDVLVTLTVAPGDTGHAFPTGDLFRRGELRVWLAGDPAHAQTTGFAREFADVLERSPRGELLFVRRQRRDTRVPPPGLGAPRVITLRFSALLPTASDEPTRVEWSLDHLLMPSPMAASQGFGEARVRTQILAGRVEVPAPEPHRAAPATTTAAATTARAHSAGVTDTTTNNTASPQRPPHAPTAGTVARAGEPR